MYPHLFLGSNKILRSIPKKRIISSTVMFIHLCLRNYVVFLCLIYAYLFKSPQRQTENPLSIAVVLNGHFNTVQKHLLIFFFSQCRPSYLSPFVSPSISSLLACDSHGFYDQSFLRNTPSLSSSSTCVPSCITSLSIILSAGTCFSFAAVVIYADSFMLY